MLAGEVWSTARGWLTPPVLFLLINVVVGTVFVASRLTSAVHDDERERRMGLMRAPSVAFDRFRCFSFSRPGVGADHHAPATEEEGEWRGLLRAPSAAFDRLRCLSFSRPAGLTAEHGPALQQPPPFDDVAAAEKVAPSPQPPPPPPLAAEPEVEREHAPRVERSRSEAAAEAPARRRPRARRARKAATEEDEDVHLAPPVAGTVNAQEPPEGARLPATGPRYARRELAAAAEVDEQADDFIRRFREQLRLQRLDSILRHRDTLRRTGTV